MIQLLRWILAATHQFLETPPAHSDRDSRTHCLSSSQRHTGNTSHASTRSYEDLAIARGEHKSHEGNLSDQLPVDAIKMQIIKSVAAHLFGHI